MNNILSFEEYEEQIAARVSQKLGSSAAVECRRVVKNNGVALDGLCITPAGEKISPTIYLNDSYERYRCGMELDEAVKGIIRVYEERNGTGFIDPEMFSDREKVCGMLACRLVSRSRNAEALKEMPHRDFLDLAVTYMCVLGETSFGNASMAVKDSHLKHWGMDPEELDEIAVKNTPKLLGKRIRKLSDFLRGIELPEADVPMYVATNRPGLYGAYQMCCGDTLEQLSEILGGDFLILPSSVHEIIALPVASGEASDLSAMVHEVNENVVAGQEVLSDRVYLYDSAGKRLDIAS
ncbi:MAG: hypothetical protein IKR68_06450 [Lachnospiraceae bacterium]|nr:hypothetical protein [Lachnospiraceae bacterium]